MLTFVCWKWKSEIKPVLSGIEYGAKHVNILNNMLNRHVHIPHQLVCMTDDPTGIACNTYEVPTKWANLGGCYRRLWMFSKEAKDVLGEKIVSIDLDVVLLADCTSLFDRDETFIANTYNPIASNEPDQYYNGSLILHKTGTIPELWEDFNENSLIELNDYKKERKAIGTDQAWIKYKLNKRGKRWKNSDGVYEARQVMNSLPPNAKLICFSGKRDPSTTDKSWVIDNWV